MNTEHPVERIADFRRLLHRIACGAHALLTALMLLGCTASAAEHASSAAVRFLNSLSSAQRTQVGRPLVEAVPVSVALPAKTQEEIEAKNRYRGLLGDQYIEGFLRAQTTRDTSGTGLRLHTLEARQLATFLGLLENILSPSGLKKLGDVTAAASQGDGKESISWIHPSYELTFFGAPDPVTPWIVQLSGEHLPLVVRFEGGEAFMLHSFMGAQRTGFELGGIPVRVLGVERDKAFALVAEMDERQREQLAMKVGVGDLTLWPDDGFPLPATDRLKAAGMSLKQRGMLLGLITEWVGILNAAYTERYLARVTATIPETWFVWAGPTSTEGNPDKMAYFRIHGPHVYIEHAPQPMLGDMHVHSTYRAQ